MSPAHPPVARTPPARLRRRAYVLLLLFSLACRAAALPATLPAPPPTAPPTVTAMPATPRPTAAVADEATAIAAVLEAMAEAVRAGDRAAYLAHVDLSDPVFATEHERWADEWSRAPLLADYGLALDAPRVSGSTATGALTVTWRTLAADVPRQAVFRARFTRAPGGAWRYAGEHWEDRDAAPFLIRAAPGLEAQAETIHAALPAVHAHVTASLGYTPTSRMQIKLYDSVDALVAVTLLSLPPIHGWNEPGEALKLYAGPGAVPEGALAHELVHFLEFDQAGTARSRMPWWLSEGFAVYIADDFAPSSHQRAQLALVAGWAASGELAPWETLSVFEETPPELWGFVYPQGYAFVTFVTEVYGVEARNAWMRAMATELDLAAATPAVLGQSFEALDAGFRAWLDEVE